MQKILILNFLLITGIVISCTEEEGDPNDNTCSNPPTVSIESSADTDCGSSIGEITVKAAGGTGTLTYSKDGNVFQESATFSGLASGNYTFTVKDANGCTATVATSVETGISFASSVQPIIQAKCINPGCHAAGGASGVDFSNFSNLSSRAGRVKTRTSEGSMPPAGAETLTAEEKQKIACWVDDGAQNN